MNCSSTVSKMIISDALDRCLGKLLEGEGDEVSSRTRLDVLDAAAPQDGLGAPRLLQGKADKFALLGQVPEQRAEPPRRDVLGHGASPSPGELEVDLHGPCHAQGLPGRLTGENGQLLRRDERARQLVAPLPVARFLIGGEVALVCPGMKPTELVDPLLQFHGTSIQERPSRGGSGALVTSYFAGSASALRAAELMQ